MFTNTLKNIPQPVIREPGGYNLLNNLNESYFMQKNNPYFGKPWGHSWQKNDLDKLNEVYNVLKNDKHAHGYSKSTNQQFLRMFIIKYYESNGFYIFPAYFTLDNDGIVTHIADPKYNNLWNDFNDKVEDCLIKTKWLTHLSFNHVLSDGRIIEHVFDPNNLYKEDETMFFSMKKIREQHELIVSLDTELVINNMQNNKQALKI